MAGDQEIRGWVYVISNPAMPGLVKVGFSTKDPRLRARELGGTGVPHPYKVEYDCLVHSPRNIEQSIHRSLSHLAEQKEWFRCTAAIAIQAIRSLVNDGIIVESSSEAMPSAPDEHPPDPLEALFSVGRLKPRGQGLWTLSSSSRVLVNNRSGRRFAAEDYSYDAGGQIKGFVLRDKETPWVSLSEIEFVT